MKNPVTENKKKCNCPCHINPGILHIKPCCNNGYIQNPFANNASHMYSHPISMDEGVLYSLQEWNNLVANGIIVSYDGSGYWVKDNKSCSEEVFNSSPLDATHVIWFNK